MLHTRGIIYNDLPAWQKRGVGLTWEAYEKEGTDPRTSTKTSALRWRDPGCSSAFWFVIYNRCELL